MSRLTPAAAVVFSLAAAAPAADPDGWADLLADGPGSPWRKGAAGWVRASAVGLDPADPRRLAPTPAADGPVWVNGPDGKLPDLVTAAEYGDLDVHLEFMLARGSNSGVKFHEGYEVQLFDSHGKPADRLTGMDCGGIYPRTELLPRYRNLDDGIPPAANAAGRPGEWQTLEVSFRAPRFDAAGSKTANARLTVTLNGTVVHRGREVPTPTGLNWKRKEAPTGRLLLQADHGPVAFRSVRVRPR